MRYLIFFLLGSACVSAQVNPNEFRVVLKLDSIRIGEKFYLQYANASDENNSERMDSLIVKDDKIVFNGEINEPVPAVIFSYRIEKVDTAFYKNLMQEVSLPEDQKEETLQYLLNPLKQQRFEFFLVGGETTIKTKDKLRTAKTEGPKAVTDFEKLKKEDREYIDKGYRMMEGFFGTIAMVKKDAAHEAKMMKKMDSLTKRMKEEVYLGYVRANPNSPLALYALRTGMPNQIDSADKYLSLFSTLSPEIQKLPSAKGLVELLESAKKTEIGKIIPDFQQWDSLGKAVNFSSFKGKYVLIELWASWCGPCRKKNPELIKIYDKYNKEKFTILGIALEENGAKDKWLMAISKDKLSWPQLTDFKGWKNAVARQWGVQAIPFNLLVDPNGKIIGKNLYGQELDDQLAALFKK